MSVPAAPPSAAEVQRKLSMHAQSPPSHRRKSSVTNPPTLPLALSGTESDSDRGASSPPQTQGIVSTADALAQQPIQGSPPTTILAPAPTAQLEVIAERPGGSGEETDDEEDEGWQPGMGRSLEELNNLTDEVMTKAGYLYKKGERRKTWKKRWFVLRQTQLSYYKTDKEYKLLRLLPVAEIHSVTPVTLKRHTHCFGIITPARTYYVQADSAQDAESWVRALTEVKSRLAGGSTAIGGGVKKPPAINVQQSTPSTMLPPEPRTPPALSSNYIPSSPYGHQQHLTSSDSEDPDTYAPDSPTTATSPRQGMRMSGQATGEDDSKIKKPIAQGYLMKLGSKRKTWRKRYFVLTAESLTYAKSHIELNKAKGSRNAKDVPLNIILDALECKVPKHGTLSLSASPSGQGTEQAGASNPNSTGGSSLTQPQSNLSGSSSTNEATGAQALPHTFKIVTPKRALLLCAASEEEEIKWLSAIRALIARRTGNTVWTSGDASGASNQGQSAASRASMSIGLPGSPSKQITRREANTSSSSSPPRGEFVLPSAQNTSGRRKDSASLTGVAATAMTVPGGSF